MDRYLDLNDLWGIPSLEDQTLALAKRLRSIRKSKGWNQTEFADRSGIPLGTLKVGKNLFEAFVSLCHSRRPSR